MNKLLPLISGALLLASASSAQTQSGKVLYSETIKMDVQLEGDAAQFAHLFPKEQTMKSALHFNSDAAIFGTVQEKEPEAEGSGEGGIRMRITGGTDDKIYTDLKEGKTTELRDFMGRKFLVSGDLKKPSWRMTGNQKTILNYPCMEAVMITDKDTVTAWFTTAIPVSAGPHGWTGLPGLILAGTINSNVSLTATAVEPGPVASGIIVQPKGGKKVTSVEYKAIVDAKMKEMGAEEGGPGNVRVIIRQD